MKIALIGYGKMGKTIERLAKEQGHKIVLVIDTHNSEDLQNGTIKAADVAIEFTRPESAVQNIKACIQAGVPVVSGTTGWLAHWEEITNLCEASNGTFFYASNFSIGVNIFFELNARLAQLMNKQTQFKASLKEIHHVHKLDAPSGTAITLAKGLVENNSNYKDWKLVEGDVQNLSNQTLPIYSQRLGEVPGTHIIHYDSPIDELEITHVAKGREGFAQGAITAAEWVLDKKGVLNMKDMLQF